MKKGREKNQYHATDLPICGCTCSAKFAFKHFQLAHFIFQAIPVDTFYQINSHCTMLDECLSAL